MDKKNSWEGVFTAVVTPFDPQGNVNYDGMIENIEYQIEEGVDGLVLLGTTGEAPTLLHDEQNEIIRLCIKAINGRVATIIGTGSYSTKQTIENTVRAQKLGADAALVVTPYYNRPTQEGLYQHFRALSKAVDLPIIPYNIQGRTGQNLQTNTLKRLFEFPNIVAIKESSGSIPQVIEVIECVSAYRPDFKVLSGDDNMTFVFIALGGHGVISTVANLIPGPIVQLVQKALQGDFAAARKIHYQLMPLFKGAFIETNPIPIKAAMNMCGLAAGPCRLPLCELMPENEQALKQIIEQYEIIGKGVSLQ